MKKFMSLAAFGLGYVLGARAGRERYDQIMRGFTRVREDPRVQQQAHHVAQVAKDQAPVARDKVSDLATSAVNKVRSSSANPDEDAEFPEERATQPDGPFSTTSP